MKLDFYLHLKFILGSVASPWILVKNLGYSGVIHSGSSAFITTFVPALGSGHRNERVSK